MKIYTNNMQLIDKRIRILKLSIQVDHIICRTINDCLRQLLRRKSTLRYEIGNLKLLNTWVYLRIII